MINDVLPGTFTREEYLAKERVTDHRNEFFSGKIYPMPPSNIAHSLVVMNVLAEIGKRLKNSDWYVLSVNMRVKVPATGLYTYPDHVIAYGKPELEDSERDTLLNPKVIIEILTARTESYDRGEKFNHYRRLVSLEEYILICTDRKQVERFLKLNEDTWNITVFDDPNGQFALNTVPVSFPLADIYDGIDIPESPLR